MNGPISVFLDTNAAIAYFRGNSTVVDAVDRAAWVGLSVISYLEFLAFTQLSPQDIQAFQEFCDQIVVVPVLHSDRKLCDEAIRLRRSTRLKLPDAIIAESAAANGASLITADARLSAAGLSVIPFVP